MSANPKGEVMTDEREMVSVDAAALREILAAITGPGHLIRELQAIRSLGNSPIDILRDDFNAWVKS